MRSFYLDEEEGDSVGSKSASRLGVDDLGVDLRLSDVALVLLEHLLFHRLYLHVRLGQELFQAEIKTKRSVYNY